MSWMEQKRLAEERAKLVTEAGELIKTAKKENRELTTEEDQKFSQLHADADKKLAKIEQYKQQEEAEKFSLADVQMEHFDVNEDPEDRKARLFNQYLRKGITALPEEQRFDMATDSTGAGQELVPQDYHSKTFEVLQDLTDVLRLGPEFIPTSDGRPYPVPLIDDSSNTGERLTGTGQNTSVDADNTSDPDTSALNLGAYQYSSRVVKLPLALVQDAQYPIESKVIKFCATRISKVLNYDLTLGTGSSQPQGFVTGAALGKTGSSTTAISYTEILDLIHSIPEVYRAGAKLTFNDSTLLAIKKLTDGDGNLIWYHGDYSKGMASTIADVPYVINYNMASMTAGAKSIVYGNFAESFCVRMVNQVQTFVFVEKYMEKLQRGYMQIVRADGGVVDNTALKYFANAAS